VIGERYCTTTSHCPAGACGCSKFLAPSRRRHHRRAQNPPRRFFPPLIQRRAKGGSSAAWQIVKDSPGLEDLWQLHFAIAGGQDHNVADSSIANVNELDQGDFIKVSAEQDGSFTVFNSRNKYHHEYRAK